MKWIVVLLFSVLYLVNADLAPVVKLDVARQDYLCVLVGSPGKNMCLFIDHNCNDTIILYQEPVYTSQTYTLYPPSVLLFLGSHAYRFNARFDGNYRNPTPYIDNMDGKICFGPMSQIWSHWTRATFSPDFVVLGAFDLSLTRETYHTFEIEFNPTFPTNVTVDDAPYYLWYDTSDVNTYLPPHLYFNVSLLDLVFDDDHHVHVGIDDTDVMVQNPYSLFYHTTMKKHNRTDTIVFGRAFARNFVIFYDAISQTKWVHPSFDFFNYGPGHNVWVYTMGAIYSLLILFWVGGVLVYNHDKPFPVSFYLMIEVLVYASSVLVLYVEVVGFVTQRFLSFYTETTSNILFASLIIFILFNTLIGVTFMLYNWNTYHNIPQRRVPLETSLFLLLWLTQVHHCAEGVNNIFLLFLAALYLDLRIVQAIFYYVHEKKEVVWFSLCYVAFGVCFFIYYNARPIIELYFHDINDPVSSIIFLFLTFCGVPSLYLANHLLMSALRKTVLDVDSHERVNRATPIKASRSPRQRHPVQQRRLPTHLAL